MAISNTAQAMLQLMRCALRGEKAEIIGEVDYDALYCMCKEHSVTAMVAIALENSGIPEQAQMPKECRERWKNARINAIRRNILFDTEREQILKDMEAAGVWYLPLKGALLHTMYPAAGMRQMADNDILFDSEYRGWMKEYMTGRGYRVSGFGKGIHDAYEKEPVYDIEMHVSLFVDRAYPQLAEYFADVKERRKKDAGNAYGYHFSDEDFYLYLMLHGYKHYANAGTGIRFLSDVFVFLQKKKQSMDWSYIRGEMEKVELAGFEEQARELALKLFADDASELTGEEEEMLCRLLGSGTYGTLSNMTSKKMRELQKDEGDITVWTKLRYIWSRVFPDYEFMCAYSPFCEKHPWSMPFFWVWRWIRALTVRRKDVISEIKAVKKQNT